MRKINISKDFLIKEYLVNKKSSIEIAKIFNITKKPVLNRLREYRIPVRTISEARQIQDISRKGKDNGNFKYDISKTKLYNLYWNKKLTMKQIAKKISCNWGTIGYKLKKYNIKIRNKSECHKGLKRSEEAKQKMSGKNSPAYGKIAHHGKGAYYKGVWMRSSYEIAYAKYLDKNNIKWQYEPKYFEIIYLYKGIKKEGTYTPDFYLPETNEYIEIKGWWRDDAEYKFNTFKSKYSNINIKVLNKEKLQFLEVIK